MPFGVKTLLGLFLLFITTFFVRNNLFNQTVAIGTLMVYVTFVHGGHPEAVISVLCILSGVAAVTTLTLYIPLLYVVTVAFTLTVFAYLLAMCIAFASGADSYALTVFMCLTYMGWYGWIRTHPPPRFPLE
jgi:hypothetical protein